jgi:hypothetical protein
MDYYFDAPTKRLFSSFANGEWLIKDGVGKNEEQEGLGNDFSTSHDSDFDDCSGKSIERECYRSTLKSRREWI